jgi:molecular chaperone DnaK (HSP70)
MTNSTVLADAPLPVRMALGRFAPPMWASQTAAAPTPVATNTIRTIQTGRKALVVGSVGQLGIASSRWMSRLGVLGRPPLPKGSPVDITFQMKVAGILLVNAIELMTGQQLTIEIEIQTGEMQHYSVDARATMS